MTAYRVTWPERKGIMVLVLARNPEDAKARLWWMGYAKTAIVTLDPPGIQGLHPTHVWVDEVMNET